MNPISIVIGNVCSLLAMITDSVSSTRKTAKEVLVVQSLSQLIYCIGTVILKGYSGAVQNVVSIIRNLVAIKKLDNRVVEWGLALLGVVLGIGFNNLGWIGLLPVIGNFQYTLVIFKDENNERAMKISFAISVALFTIFNAAISNVVGVCGDLFILATTLIMLFKNKKKK